MKALIGFALLALQLTIPGPCRSGDASDAIRKIDSVPLPSKEESFSPEVGSYGLTPDHLDSAAAKDLQASFSAYFRYRQEGYAHRKRVFEWQLFTSRVIFWVVIGLVAIGVYFSWVQFRLAMVKDREGHSPGRQEDTGLALKTTSIEASTQGIKVSSDILGVIILTLSLLFFYLYLVYVYPISNAL